MAAGNKINGSGIIQYANGTFSGGTTPSLLTIFTDTSGATLSNGDIMQPRNITNNVPGFRVNNGSYAGDYYINQNDPTGYTAAYVARISPRDYILNYFHNYIHYPTDQMMVFSGFNNSSPWGADIQLQVGGNDIMKALGIGMGSYDPTGNGNNLDYYANFPGSAGAYQAGSVNTDWTVDITVGIDGASPPGAMQMWDINVYDAFGTVTLLSTGPFNLDISGPTTYNTSFTCNYWSAMNFQITIN